MSKITEYTSVNAFDSGDVLLKDGSGGTKIIPVESAASEFMRLGGQTDKNAEIETALTNFGSNLAGLEEEYVATNDYAIGDFFMVENKLYKATAAIADGATIVPDTNCVETDISAELKAVGSTVNDLSGEIAKKANVDGYYTTLSAGTADQLMASQKVHNSDPYIFRTSGGTSDIANREELEIVGGSIIWNQLVDDSDSSVTVTSGHKYIAKVDNAYSVVVSDGTTVAVTGGTDEVFDLTQMFGSEIADHIYELEQAEAGAGVAWFRKYFPNDYYEYNPGELMHVSDLQSHDTVGFNLFDKTNLDVVASKYISNDGNLWSGSNYKATGYIGVVPGMRYYLHPTEGSNPSVAFYTVDKKFISAVKYSDATSKLVTAPSNAHYLRASYNKNSENYFCVNLSWSGTRDGEYEPYVKHSYPLDSSLTLRGIPKLTADGDLTYDGDIYKPDGTVERRYGTRAYESGDESLSNAITDGTNTVYKLTTPTTEQAEPYTSPQIVDDWGTEEFVTTSLVPVGHNTSYPANLRDKLQHLPDLPDDDGYYMTQVDGTQMSLIRFRIPQAPAEDGTYVLKATVTDGVPVYTWVDPDAVPETEEPTEP